MSEPNEQDPLLLKTNRAPEIQGSRPTSIKDIKLNEPQVSQVCEGDEVEAEYTLPKKSSLDDLAKGVLDVLWTGFLLIFFCWCLIAAWSFLPRLIWPKTEPASIEERVRVILRDTPLIDGHNDLAFYLRYVCGNHIYSDNFTKGFEEGGMVGQVDLPRLEEGQNGGVFWSAWTACPSNASDFSDENYRTTVAQTYQQLDVLHRLRHSYPTHFSPPPDSSIALPSFQKGLMISPLAIEGLHQIGNSISNLRTYHSLGARYITLTHNCHNKYADAALLEVPGGGTKKASPHWGGISLDGRKVVQEMNRLGLIIDLSHTSYDTLLDAFGGGKDGWEGSKAPVMFSHSSAYSICPHPRNVPDDILQLVKKKNGIVMVNFTPDFVACVEDPDSESGLPRSVPQNATLGQVVKHLVYIGELIGYDHVGLGSDFDGMPSLPKGLEDVSKFPDLVGELLRRGISDNDVRKVVGGNILRVWGEVDRVAEEMRRKGVLPLEDDLPELEAPIVLGS